MLSMNLLITLQRSLSNMAEFEPAYLDITRVTVQLNNWIPQGPAIHPEPLVAD